jgi:hypothetical protein
MPPSPLLKIAAVRLVAEMPECSIMSLILVTGLPCLLEEEGAGKDGRGSTVSRSAVGIGEAVPPEGGVLGVAAIQASDQRLTLVRLHQDLLMYPLRSRSATDLPLSGQVSQNNVGNGDRTAPHAASSSPSAGRYPVLARRRSDPPVRGYVLMATGT